MFFMLLYNQLFVINLLVARFPTCDSPCTIVKTWQWKGGGHDGAEYACGYITQYWYIIVHYI